MEGKTLGIIALIIIGIAGGWYLFSATPAKAPTTNETPAANTAANPAPPTGATVAYTSQGFSPKNITVRLGTAVTFVNQSSGSMWVASAAHPSHMVYGGTSLSQHCPDTTNTAFDECTAVSAGGSYSFTFNKAGDWKYHNHVDASDFGEVVVTP